MWNADDAYDRFMGRWSRGLAPSVVGLALDRGASRGCWLDVGAGSGAVTDAILAADVAMVHAVEPSPAFAAHLRRRFAEAPVDVHNAGVDGLPDGPFDAAVCSLVVNFTPDPVAAMQAIGRAVDGGPAVVAVWDMTDDRSFLWRFWAAVEAVHGERIAADERMRWDVCSPEGLRRTAIAAGWDSQALSVDVPTPFADADDLWAPFLLGVGPSGDWLSGRPVDEQDAIRDHLVADAFGPGAHPMVLAALLVTT